MKLENWRKITDKIIIIVCILAMIPILWIAIYNHPSTDDYNFSDKYTWEIAHSKGSLPEIVEGAWKTSTEMYYNWQGNYTCSFLGALHPGIYGTHEEYYKLTTTIILLNTLVGIFLFVKELLKCLDIDWKKYWIITLPIYLTIVEGLPSPVQGLFWYTGSMVYMLFWAWMLWEIALLLSCLNKEKIAIWKWVVSVFLCFWNAGGNHVTAFAAVLITLGFMVFAICKKKNKNIPFYIATFICSTTGFLANAFSPGTRVRASMVEKQGVIATIVKSGINGINEFLIWFKGPQLCLLVLVSMIVARTLVNEKNEKKFKFRYLICLFVLFYVLYCAMLCVPFYAMGNFGVGRVTNIRYATMILMDVVLFLYLAGCLEVCIRKVCSDLWSNVLNQFTSKQKKWTAVISTIVFMFILSVFTGTFGGNVTVQSMREVLNGEAKQYSQQCEEAIGHDIGEPVAKPKMIYFSTNDPEVDS